MRFPLVRDRFDPAEEGWREALCALGNGYFVTRGAAPESPAGEAHYPGTYLAGGYDRACTVVAGRRVENEDLVNLPNWLCLRFRAEGGEWFSLDEAEVLEFRQSLDVEGGLLRRDLLFRDGAGRVFGLAEQRLVAMHQPHLAAIQSCIRVENWSGRLEICSALDGNVTNSGVHRYSALNGRHLAPLETGVDAQEQIWLKVQYIQSQLQVAQAARTRVLAGGRVIAPERRSLRRSGYVAQHLFVPVAEGECITVEKVVALYSSRDRGISECALQARQAVAEADDFDAIAAAHRRQWDQLWARFDTTLELSEPASDAHTTSALRLHVFHLLQTVSMHTEDLDVGVPARGWHGEAYRGHIFWDELFIFPLLNLRMPETTRALLKYRCRRLPAARAAARAAGFRGAMFPWQSGSDGREECQRLHLNPRSGRWIADHSHLQRHVNAAIAYNVWQYFQATEDMEFLAYHGAELVLEIARFWASASSFNPALGRYEIKAVMGPDEYHDGRPGAAEPGLNNNSYTNLMAVWVLDCALCVLERLSGHRRLELCQALELGPAELALWSDVCRRMRLVFHADGVLSQFEGYEQLAELDWDAYRRQHGDIRRLDRILEAEGKTPNAYKLSKQADVLMLFYLLSAEEIERLVRGLGYDFDPQVIPRTIEYYTARTAHGSTLSRVVGSWVLARRDRERSWALFQEALDADLGDYGSGTTHEGIHLGAMAGTVDLVQRCYTGIELRDDCLHLNPCLPRQLERMKLRLRYRTHLLVLEFGHEHVVVESVKVGGPPIRLRLWGQLCDVRGGERRSFEPGPGNESLRAE